VRIWTLHLSSRVQAFNYYTIFSINDIFFIPSLWTFYPILLMWFNLPRPPILHYYRVFLGHFKATLSFTYIILNFFMLSYSKLFNLKLVLVILSCFTLAYFWLFHISFGYSKFFHSKFFKIIICFLKLLYPSLLH